MHALCADFNFVYTAIMCVTLTQQQSYIVVLLETLLGCHSDHTMFLLGIYTYIATACTLCIVTLLQQMKMPLDVSLL